jgi:uncharacterized protein YqgC (DUF456 family)
MMILMFLGLFGLIVPIFPGNVIIWAAALVYAVVDGFDGRAVGFFIPITLLTVLAVGADNLLMGAKARQAGASWWSIGIALVSALVASVFLTPIAGLIVAPLALFLAEYVRSDNWDAKTSWDTTKGLMLGCGWAFVARFSLGAIAIGLFAWWVFG